MEEAFRELLHECCIADPDIDETSALRALLEREKQGGTFIGEEIAIPHARLENLKSLLLLSVSIKLEFMTRNQAIPPV